MVKSAALCLVVGWIFITLSEGAEACAELTLKDREGEVTSPNFPAQYYPNTCTTWTVQKSYGSVVTISFSHLDLLQGVATEDGKCSDNYVEVESLGYNMTFCGHHAEPFTSFPYDRRLSIRFISGPIPRGHGFRLEYFVGPWKAEYCAEDQFHCSTGKCIPGHWKCNGRHECEHGGDERFCHGLPVAHTLHPVTQRQTTPLPVWRRKVTSHSCSHTFHNQTGQFKLLMTPDTVYNTCSWLIDIPGNVDKIVLRFLRLDIDSDAYIWVYKGRKANFSNSLGMFDGHSKIRIVTAHSNSMFIEFRLAFDNPASISTDLNFVAEYSAVLADYHPDVPMEDTCSYKLDRYSGNFSMPPKPLPGSAIRNCSWHIFKPYAGSYIHLLMSNVYLQPGESIKVYDGQIDLAPTLAVVNSSNQDKQQPLSVRSSGSHMLVQFTTPDDRNYGSYRWVVFDAKYHFEDHCPTSGEMHCGAEDNKCFSLSQSCDGIWDCPLSGIDEQGCYMCPAHSYSCGNFGGEGNYKCYFKHDRCTGASVCPNDADELNCNEEQCSESHNLFLCANMRCILYNFICDGTDDCGDNSDEEGCSLGNSRKVIVAAVVGSLLCSLLLVLSLGCACKFYYLRHHYHHHQHHYHRGPRYDTPLTRLQAELFRRRAPPPPYHEAMLTSRPYEEAVREYLAQTEQRREPQSEQGSGDAEQGDSGNGGGSQSVQNLIGLMDFSEQTEEQQQNVGQNSGRLEILISSDTSSDSESEGEENGPGINLAENDSGHIEMTENLGRGSSHAHPETREGSLLENISEDSASAILSADGTEMTSLAEEEESDRGKASEENPASLEMGKEESDKENSSDADSVCILCLDEDPAALDDGSDTRCLLQEV